MRAAAFLLLAITCQTLSAQRTGYDFESAKVWLEESGCRLTQGDLEYHRFMTEFILGAPLTKAQRSLLRSQVMDACTDRTTVFLQSRQASNALLRQCRIPTTNPAQIGLLSSAQAYAYSVQPEDPDKALVLGWMEESNPILTTDTIQGLVFRLGDAYACLNLFQLNHFMLKNDIPVQTNESWQSAVDSLTSRYDGLGYGERKYLSSLQFVWVQTSMAWQQLDAETKQEIAHLFRDERFGKYVEGTHDLKLTEDVSRALIEAAGITPDMVIDALGTGRSDLFGWQKLDTLQW